MAVIKSFSLHPLRNNKHFQFQTEFRGLVEKHTPSALKVAPLFEAYLPHYAREDEALKKIVKSALTRRIQDADAARDEAFSALAETCRTACRHFNPSAREAALRVQVVFDTYGNVAKLPLNEETSAVCNLLQDLASAKYAADVNAAGLSGWAAALASRNNAFEALVKQRFEETGERSDVVLKTERAEADAAYRKIVNRINALAEVEGEAAYKAFIDTLNAVIAKYAVKSPRRRPSGASGGAGGDDDDDDGGDDGADGGGSA